MIMEELLIRLERQIKELLDQHHQLTHSNQTLHHGQHQLAREKELLLDRQQKAIIQIQSLVSKLKLIEVPS